MSGHTAQLAPQFISPELLVDALPLVAYAADAAGRVTHVDRHWLNYTGFSLEESLKLGGTDAIHPDDLSAVLETWGRAVRDLTPYQLEYRLRRADGAERWQLGRAEPVYGADGSLLGWLGTATDIHDSRQRSAGMDAADDVPAALSERKRSEEALRHSEERLRLGFEIADFVLAEVDYAADTIQFTPDAAQLYGFDETSLQISRAQVHDRVHSDDRAGLEAALVRAFDPNGSGWIACEYRVVHENGDVRWLNVRKQIFFDRSVTPHRPSHAILAAQDITERKRREENLAFLAATLEALGHLSSAEEIAHVAGARLSSHLGLTHCLFVEIDEEGGQAAVFFDQHVTDAFSLLGTYRIEEFHSDSERQLLKSGQSVVIADVSTGTHSEAVIANFEALGIRALITTPHVSGGRWRFALSAQHNHSHNWQRDEIGLLHDFTTQIYLRLERARAEEALRNREASFRTFFDSVDEGFCVCEMILDSDRKPVNYRFLEVNRLFEDQTGLRDAAGRTALELVPGLEQHWIDLYGRVVLTGEPARFEQGAEAMGRWFDVYASRIGDESSLRFAVIFKDTSERKRMELRLREINEAQKRFVSDAAHELRAPLTSIRGNLELLIRYPNAPATDREEMLSDATREAGRLSRLISDLLLLARGDMAAAERRHSVEFSAVIGEALRGARHFAAQHELTSQLEVCTVLGDEERLRELVLILLENAAKYTPAGGRLEISLQRDGDSALLRVGDNGPGIASEDLERVFERFYRADPSRSPGADPGGTGLGLPIARQIVQQHGGEIWLESTPGTGTVAVVRLPLAERNQLEG
jgi:PAS domain S-box-containing protein